MTIWRGVFGQNTDFVAKYIPSQPRKTKPTKKHEKAFLLYRLTFLCLQSLLLNAQVITSPEIDALVEKTLKTFDVPGIAVAVVKDGKVIHAKG